MAGGSREDKAGIDILIIEDDRALGDVVAGALEDAGYRAQATRTGAQGLALAREESPALCLVDLGLPDLDGLSVCRQLVALRGPRVMVITAVDDANAAETALEAGAEDYVRKPFHLNELLARVRAVLRRGQPEQSDVLRVGRVAIDRARCVASIDGREVLLSATELRLLTFLAEHPGWVFSKEALLEALWPDDRATHAVQVHISNLRHKIEPNPSRPSLVVTVKGLGYRLDPSSTAAAADG
jgi:DNA-binding response OmpR family regulator